MCALDSGLVQTRGTSWSPVRSRSHLASSGEIRPAPYPSGSIGDYARQTIARDNRPHTWRWPRVGSSAKPAP